MQQPATCSSGVLVEDGSNVVGGGARSEGASWMGDPSAALSAADTCTLLAAFRALRADAPVKERLLGIVPAGFIPFLFERKKIWLRELDWQVRWVDAHLHQLSDGQRCHTGPDQREKTPGVLTTF